MPHQFTGKEYYIEIDGQKIPVSEEVYRAYKRPVWTEHKRKERIGSILSLDAFEEDGFEPSDPSPEPAEIVAGKLLLEELFKALDELDPDSRRICELIAQGATEREIAAVLGIRQSTLNYRKHQLLTRLRERLVDFI